MRIHVWRVAAAVAAGAIAAAIGISTTLGDDSQSGPSGPDAGDLSVNQLAGERLVAGFSGEQPPARLRRMIGRGQLAGVILFSGNFDDRAEARSLIQGLQAIRRPPGLRDPLLVMVDQEGGLVKRLPGPPTASAEQMGARGADFSREQGRLTARSLSGAGFNVDLAPVLDVGRVGSAISDEERSFGASAAKVSQTGVAFGRGLQAEGVDATAKHFPGLGEAQINTDFGVVEIDLSKSQMRAVDEQPFETFIAAGGELVMMSNAIYPAFSERPAVFTRALATAELRDRLGFEGVSISDALQAAAAEAFGGPAKTARAAARAGTDLLLFRQYQAADRAGAALRTALRARELPRAEFEASVQRVLDLRAGLPD
jgi:beta-N-acetylhexosaminidase